ncbi:MAG: MFS transporter [Clostridiaceae bacterium]|nr:MFS transporter [Clostridiaceae bacterium]
MKLNNKRTILTGMGFLSICAFWQMYDNIIPIILTNTFKLSETVSGAIMASDNLLALFLLPFFGALSDKCHTRIGKRMPFILAGTGMSVVLMNILPRLDNSYYAEPSSAKLYFFIIVLGLLLISMGTYRSPAVALMPDITPKPLRSKANAIINLMGAVGGVVYLLIASGLYSASRVAGLTHVDYSDMFGVVSIIMVVSVLVLFLSIKENKLSLTEAHKEDQSVGQQSGKEKLPVDVKKSLVFLLFSISLWFMGYNAITTWFTTYASRIWNMVLGESSMCLTVATVGAIASYIPIGIISSKIGRKKTITAGVILLSFSFAMGYVFSVAFEGFSPLLYILFAIVGLAWAAINVNSLPMVVEMCSGGDIGKFTGYYYTFSMAAQSVTPIFAGWLMKHIGYASLFPYSAVFVALALVTLSFVKHGDSKVISKKGLENFDIDN